MRYTEDGRFYHLGEAVIETDEADPKTVAKVVGEGVFVKPGYRARLLDDTDIEILRKHPPRPEATQLDSVR